jgi:hypothetical protein
MFRLIALAQGQDGKANDIAGGRVLWADAESRSQAQLTDSLLKLKQIGFPFEFLALRYGLTPTEVADLLSMRDKELQADPMGAFTSLMARDPAQGDNTNGNQPESPTASAAA